MIESERHRVILSAVQARPEQEDAQRFERVRDGIVDRRSFITAMDHAIIALRIPARTVVIPIRRLHEVLKAFRISLIDQQIAWLLPTEDVVSRITPRRALIAPVASQEVHKHA